MSPFDYKTPSEAAASEIDRVREQFKNLHEALLSMPECRERSLAITKLEEAAMWANKGIVSSM